MERVGEGMMSSQYPLQDMFRVACRTMFSIFLIFSAYWFQWELMDKKRYIHNIWKTKLYWIENVEPIVFGILKDSLYVKGNKLARNTLRSVKKASLQLWPQTILHVDAMRFQEMCWQAGSPWSPQSETDGQIDFFYCFWKHIAHALVLHRKSRTTATVLPDLVRTDVCGPIDTQSVREVGISSRSLMNTQIELWCAPRSRRQMTGIFIFSSKKWRANKLVGSLETFKDTKEESWFLENWKTTSTLVQLHNLEFYYNIASKLTGG